MIQIQYVNIRWTLSNLYRLFHLILRQCWCNMSRQFREGHEKHRKESCELCGISKSRRKLDVHHKDKNNENDDPSNLETLCSSCHARIHQIGRLTSEETRKKLSKASKGENNGFFGKTHNEFT